MTLSGLHNSISSMNVTLIYRYSKISGAFFPAALVNGSKGIKLRASQRKEWQGITGTYNLHNTDKLSEFNLAFFDKNFSLILTPRYRAHIRTTFSGSGIKRNNRCWDGIWYDSKICDRLRACKGMPWQSKYLLHHLGSLLSPSQRPSKSIGLATSIATAMP